MRYNPATSSIPGTQRPIRWGVRVALWRARRCTTTGATWSAIRGRGSSARNVRTEAARPPSRDGICRPPAFPPRKWEGGWGAGFLHARLVATFCPRFQHCHLSQRRTRKSAIVSTKFATILRPNERLSSEISSETGSVQHGAGADRRRGSKGPRVLEPKQLTFL